MDRAHLPKLTKRMVDAAEIGATEYFIWDDDIPSFGLRVLPSKRKSSIVQYRAGRRSRRMSLGLSTALTCKQARSGANAFVAAAKNGEGPGSQVSRRSACHHGKGAHRALRQSAHLSAGRGVHGQRAIVACGSG